MEDKKEIKEELTASLSAEVTGGQGVPDLDGIVSDHWYRCRECGFRKKTNMHTNPNCPKCGGSWERIA